MTQTQRLASFPSGRTWSLSDFRMGERVGASRLSAVYHAMHKSTGMELALKCYLRDRLDAFSLAQIKREVSIHAKLAHPSVVPFYGSFEDERGNIYLLHEYARGGDVFALMNKSGGTFSEAQTCRQVIQPVASAVAYLHARGITHRDIKPENLLVSDVDAACKVTDFGFAMDFTQNQCKTRLGTTDYMAPEIVRCDKAMRERLRAENRSGYGPEVDCWAIGVLAYECLVGAAPFEGGGTEEVYARILTGKYHLPGRFTPEAADFIARALDLNPGTRISAEQMLRHPWIVAHTQSSEPSPEPARRRRTSMQSNLRDVLENEPSVMLSEDEPGEQPEVFGLRNPASTDLLSYSASSSPAGLAVGGAGLGGGHRQGHGPGEVAEVFGQGPPGRFEPHQNYHRARSDPQQRALANASAMRYNSEENSQDDLRANSFSHRIHHTFKRGWGRVREFIYSGESGVDSMYEGEMSPAGYRSPSMSSPVAPHPMAGIEDSDQMTE
ncbi:CALK protein [Micromonas commoda]|uniref:CALK protein n=1 Tax=Micromonas commoda (strain RCC299 / NOUM17 / CCMP2709) TaxID=296587 RepID=C1E8M0_MICCC|nr:CALK protein [Micromonas commoda]ACO64177.1 CALK protein [Micromonas commoda]|eukprot:XP_002502919.1 CALK protein [Micromonas commoda]